MELKAVLVVGAEPTPETERWSGHPISSLELFGKPIVQHLVERLNRFGVDSVTIVVPQGHPVLQPTRGVNIVSSAPDQLWRSAETVFNLYAQDGAEIVVAMRVGPYIEFELEHILYFHHENKNRVTRLIDGDGQPLPLAIVDASRRNDAAFLFRSQLCETRVPGADLVFRGYVNPLRDIADFRRLAQDALMLDCELRPEAPEVKPGVWAAEDAVIEKGARLVAPCYIGGGAKVRAGAVVTRMACIERNSEVDLGTMVDDSSILPFSYVGPGLDICHSIVGYSKVANLPKNATVAIADPKLTAELATSAVKRRLGAYAESFTAAAAAVMTNLTSKRSAAPSETGNVEHGAAPAKSARAAAKAG